MKILIVDDNEDARKLLAELLARSGFETVEAENGKKAIEILNNVQDIDLIISDVLMPVMDGFKLCYEVKSNQRFRRIPFIFFTGSYISLEDQNFGLKLGADDYIIKPVKFETLLNKIQRILNSAEVRTPQVEIEQTVYLAEYNARLVNKLEDKLTELKEAYDLLNKKSQELEALNSIFIAINQSSDLKSLFEKISPQIKKLFKPNAINFFIYDREKNALKLEFTSPEKGIFSQYKLLPFKSDFATDIIVDKKLTLRTNLTPESTKIRAEIFKEGYTTFLEVPLKTQREFWGLVELAYREEGFEIDPGMLELLDTLSNQIAIKIENFALFFELKASEERYKNLVHSTPGGLIVLDESLNILFSSKFANEIFGTNLEGKNLTELLKDENLATFCLSSKEIEKTFETNYGDRTFLISISKRIGATEHGYCTAVISDITELKKLQEEKRRMEIKLWQEYKLASIGQLAGGIAHNLRNPLAVLNLGLQSLKRRGIESENIERLLKQVDRMTQIIESLTLKTREEIEKQKKRFDLNELIRKELEILEFDSFYKHKVEKRIELYNKPLVIEAVYSDFSSGISQILRNAVDAMRETQTKILTVRTWEDQTNIYVEVKDTGVGIPEEIMDKIFEPFFTTKNSISSGMKGIGLGLTITYQSLKIYGVEFEIDSEVGKGTSFKVKIPKEKVCAFQK